MKTGVAVSLAAMLKLFINFIGKVKKMKAQKFIVVALLVCMIFSSVSFAVTKWSCVGDSITAGFKLKPTDQYVYKLGVLLGSEYDVGNFGNSGKCLLFEPILHSSYWGTSIWQYSWEFEPDIVTIMLGCNDAIPENIPYGGLLGQYELDHIDYVNYYRNLPSNPRVIILTCTPVKLTSDRYEGLALIRPVQFDVAAATGVEVIDMNQILIDTGMTEDEMLKDYVHLSPAGNTVVAEALYNYITGGGPVCDDGTCDAGEDQCNCPEDCGAPPSTETTCDDGIDEDCDNYTDCDDSDCLGDPACPTCGDANCDPGEDQCNCPDDCGTPPSTETSCTDGVDNDCDNYTDCDDSDCDGDPACPDCVAKGGACTDNADCCSGNCLPAGRCK